ncbi:hypothetical protein EV421DRAFT_1906333 [Armillaria borealis]|uniref:Uncharacterized protein n=1 Tax=Armillaria borealis TaxID=47425 RepID=A0AA39JBK9_9AGAR|nr:hypothetical protein EV421DRAFT_1906333 [Armillaria borealis]
MEYTGVFATACKHAFIESMVNLISGEKFGFIDKAVFHAFESTNYDHAEGFIGSPELMSFNCGCQYSINMLKHFEENYPKWVPTIQQLHMAIPLLHIHDHKDDFMYLVCILYMICTVMPAACLSM